MSKSKTLLILIILAIINITQAETCDDINIDKEILWLVILNDSHDALSALTYSDSLINILHKQDHIECEKILGVFFQKGKALEILQSYENALIVYYYIIKIAESNEFHEILAETYLSIALIHEKIGRSIDTGRNLSNAKKIIDKHKLNKTLSRYAIRYASYHRIFNSLDTAKIYAKLAVNLGTKYEVKNSVIDGHLILGIISTNIDTAISHFEIVSNLFIERDSYYAAISQIINIAYILNKSDRNIESLDYLRKATEYLDKMQPNTNAHNNYSSRVNAIKSSYFQSENQLDSALYYLKTSIKQDRMSRTETNNYKISQLEIEKAVNTQKRKVEKLTNQKKLYLILLGIGFFTIGTLAFLFKINLTNRKKISNQNDIISAKNKELSIALNKQSILLSEIHHRVKNNLQMVVSLLILQGQHSKNQYTKNQLLSISDKVRSIALIHNQLYADGKFDSLNLFAYFENLFVHHSHITSNTSNINYQVNINNLYLNLETVIPLGIICSELIGNSIKYASQNNNLKLELSIEIIDKIYHFTYSDNGNGYLEKELKRSGSGMGSMLIFSMVKQLQGKTKSYNNNGAIFSLLFVKKEVSAI